MKTRSPDRFEYAYVISMRIEFHEQLELYPCVVVYHQNRFIVTMVRLVLVMLLPTKMYVLCS